MPSEDARNAIETLRRNFGIDASAHVPRVLAEINLSLFDLIVAIDDPGSHQVFSTLRDLGISEKMLLKWKITDPLDGNDRSQYDRCALETVRNLEGLKKVIGP